MAGNAAHTLSTYDSITGRLNGRTTASTSQIQNLTYQWDKAGNLAQRKDVAANLTEIFSYDNLYRVTSSTLNNLNNLTVTYSPNGNILTKTGLAGNYDYAATQTGCTYSGQAPQPHAVRSAGGVVYCYDKNGNMTARGGQPTTWASYNLPTKINKTATTYTQFSYGAGRARYKQVSVTAAGQKMPAGTETTIYIGALFEKVTKPSAVTEYKHYILAGGEAVAIKTLRSNGVNDVRYLHKDHLGSVDAVTNETGALVTRFSFDAFGKRRAAATWSGSPTAGEWTAAAGVTHRGFTYHEQLDNVDLVHMNGRVYDPNIGRFLSADPVIQAPLMSQSLNRYSYVMNNPLSLVDPSGFSWLSKLFHSAVFRTLLAIVVAIALPQLIPALQSFWGAVLVGAIAGGIAAGNLQGALLGAVTAGLFYGAGSLGRYLGTENGGVGHAILHGAAGCLSAVAGGGKCGQGAVSAAFADFGGAHVHNFGNKLADAMMRGVLGGAAAELGGGKFGDGLYQGIAGYAFNDLIHGAKVGFTYKGAEKLIEEIKAEKGLSEPEREELLKQIRGSAETLKGLIDSNDTSAAGMAFSQAVGEDIGKLTKAIYELNMTGALNSAKLTYATYLLHVVGETAAAIADIFEGAHAVWEGRTAAAPYNVAVEGPVNPYTGSYESPPSVYYTVSH